MRDLKNAGTIPTCTHETSTQDLNLPCQACLLAERDRLREALREIAERRGLDDGQERDPALIAAAALSEEQAP